MNIKAMEEAIKAAGSQTALAKILQCTPQNVQRMCATGKVPAKHVLKIEAATGVSRSLLCPDLYPAKDSTLSQTILASRDLQQEVGSAVQASSISEQAKLDPAEALTL